MARGRTKIFFDGGCRPNPGMMTIAVVMDGVAAIERDIGIGGSMDAEWLALIAALRLAQARGLEDYVLVGDALAVIAQATARAKCRGANLGHMSAFRALAGAGCVPPIRHVKRTQNLAGIVLARALSEQPA